MRRLLLAFAAFLVFAPPAHASWSWPVQGEVITQYRNGADPYAGGQHRGIDIAAAAGTPVVAADRPPRMVCEIVPGYRNVCRKAQEGSR